MIFIVLITVCVTLWCLFSFALYAYYYVLEVILDLPLIGDSPCSAHTALKVIIQKIIREANELPKLKGEGTTNTLEQTNKTYEDLLSTAILNKIISTSQSQHIDTPSSSRTNSVYSHRSTSSKCRRRAEKEYFFGEETLDHKWKNIDTDTGSVSSLEEWVHSDSSLGSTKYVDKVSLTIKQRIEEVTSTDSDHEDDEENQQRDHDDVEYFRSNSSFSNEEPNWFLQKRQFRCGTSSPVPVPMLVPDPTTEAKVLIGDKEADETSDLSDAASDFDEHDLDDQIGLMGVKNHLIEAKRLIGGMNPLVDLSVGRLSDDEVSADSGVKECKDMDEVESETLSNGRKHENGVAASVCSDSSIAERDTEYTEKYATLPRTILITQKENGEQKRRNNEHMKLDLRNIQINGEERNEEKQEEFTGIYSQREKDKWKHAIELENNPYSKENIEKRIKSRNSMNSLFGSDYYVRQACLPSGAKKSEVGNSMEIEAENSTLDQEHSLEEIQENQADTDVFPATRVFLDESDPSSSEKPNSTTSPEAISLEQIDQDPLPSLDITSDSDASLVNCYDVTQSVVYRKLSKDNNEEIQTAEQFFGFESLDAYSNHEDTSSTEPEPPKPVAKPRKNLISNPIADTIVNEEKLEKFKMAEDNFDAIPYIIHRRSDNTLIKKIYSDPSVRSFALNNRNKLPIPVDDKPKIKKTLTPQKLSPDKATPKPSPESVKLVTPEKSEDSRSSDESSLKYGDVDCFSDRNRVVDGEEKEINELKEQKLVSSILKKFSKSSIDLSTISDEILDQKFPSNLIKSRASSVEKDSKSRYSLIENEERSESVKDLRKKFEQFDAKAKSEKAILYSLTGRSISKQFKERLRGISNDSLSLSQIHSLSLTNLLVEENTR